MSIMGSAMKITKRLAVKDGAVYGWVRDDDTSGYVFVDEEMRAVYPCNASGGVIGQMSVSAHDGDVVNPDPALEGRFVVVAAAIFREWDKMGRLPEFVSRNYG